MFALILIFPLTTVAETTDEVLIFVAKLEVKLATELVVGLTFKVSLKSTPSIVTINSSPCWAFKIVIKFI